MNIETLIDQVTTKTLIKLRKSNMLKNDNMSAFEKTEEVLKNYNNYKKAAKNDDNIKTKRLVKIIKDALKTIENDTYYDIIEQFYFKGKTREDISEYFNCDVKTISRNKRRLINQIKVMIFSDETINEIFFK